MTTPSAVVTDYVGTLDEAPPMFASVSRPRPLGLPARAHELARLGRELGAGAVELAPVIDDRTLEVYARARDPRDPFELRDLWLGRVEHELGADALRPSLARRWRESAVRRSVTPEEVLTSRVTVRLVKELFNFYFRDDLYGELRSDDHLILSSGSVDEQAWGLPETLKDCVRYALTRDWYGYSDSCGRVPAREAVAAYENTRIIGASYGSENVAITMGGTVGISSLADVILSPASPTGAPVLCGIPNYPPLVETIARRREVSLVPLPCRAGQVSLAPLIAALTPDTPMVLLQTVANPTGAALDEDELAALIGAASPSTMIVLDECHEWLGPVRMARPERAAANVIRVSSLSKTWSAPGMKVGWFLADARFVADYYEYASTTFGGPPSFLYTMIEVLARMERWLLNGVDLPGRSEVAEFESSYQLDVRRLREAYRSYRGERLARDASLTTLRDAAVGDLGGSRATLFPARYSINFAASLPGWTDSYRCFRDLLRDTGVSVFPGILTFCFSGGIVRLTPAKRWDDLTTALARLRSRLDVPG